MLKNWAPPGSWRELELPGEKLLSIQRCAPSTDHAGIFRIQETVKDRLEACLGLTQGDSRLEASHYRQKIIGGAVQTVPARRHLRLHRDRDVEVWLRTGLHGVEAERSDTDDRERMSVDLKCLIKDGWIGAEARAPIDVIEHRDRVRTRRSFVG